MRQSFFIEKAIIGFLGDSFHRVPAGITWIIGAAAFVFEDEG